MQQKYNIHELNHVKGHIKYIHESNQIKSKVSGMYQDQPA